MRASYFYTNVDSINDMIIHLKDYNQNRYQEVCTMISDMDMNDLFEGINEDGVFIGPDFRVMFVDRKSHLINKTQLKKFFLLHHIAH